MDKSFELAKTAVYANPPIGARRGPFRYDQAYVNNSKSIAQKRIMQAGMRLANILNTELQ